MNNYSNKVAYVTQEIEDSGPNYVAVKYSDYEPPVGNIAILPPKHKNPTIDNIVILPSQKVEMKMKRGKRINNTRFYGQRRNADNLHQLEQVKRTVELHEKFKSGKYHNRDNLIVETGRAVEFLMQIYNTLVFQGIGKSELSSENADD